MKKVMLGLAIAAFLVACGGSTIPAVTADSTLTDSTKVDTTTAQGVATEVTEVTEVK
jgi:hypothetical protein